MYLEAMCSKTYNQRIRDSLESIYLYVYIESIYIESHTWRVMYRDSLESICLCTYIESIYIESHG